MSRQYQTQSSIPVNTGLARSPREGTSRLVERFLALEVGGFFIMGVFDKGKKTPKQRQNAAWSILSMACKRRGILRTIRTGIVHLDNGKFAVVISRGT